VTQQYHQKKFLYRKIVKDLKHTALSSRSRQIPLQKDLEGLKNTQPFLQNRDRFFYKKILKDLKHTALSCRSSDCAVLAGFFVQASVILLIIIIGLLPPLLSLLVAQHTTTAIVFG
jgi:hypothetical protein